MNGHKRQQSFFRRMSRKSLNNQKGASLVYALVVITMLILIGISLASFAVMSIRIAQIDNTNDRAFYLSDAAVEETLYKLETLAHEADASASAWVSGKTYYNQNKWQVFLSKLERDVSNAEITQDQAAEYLKTAQAWEYNKYYNFVLQGSPGGDSTSTGTWLNSDYDLVSGTQYVTQNSISYKNNFSYQSSSSGLNSSTMQNLNTLNLDPSQYSSLLQSYKSTGKPDMAVNATYVSNVCQVTILANGAYNSTHKSIEMSIGLESPDYTQIVSATTSKVAPHRNQLVDNALTAGRNILVADIKSGDPDSGQTTYVDGNVYAYGDFPETSTYRLPSLGGVMVGYDSSSDVLNSGIGPYAESDLTGSGHMQISNGDLITRSAVTMMNDRSKLTVSGSTYANGFIAGKDSSATSFATGKDLVLVEDLILNGSNPVVNIGNSADMSSGTLWGLMDYNIASSYSTKKSDISSSVIVNTTSATPEINCNYIKVGGVAYYNVYREALDDQGSKYWKAYQTGESFTTNNQSVFYQTEHPDTSINTGFFDYNAYGDFEYPGNQSNVTTIPMIEYKDENGNLKDDVTFKATHYITLGQENPSFINSRDRNILLVNSIKALYDNATSSYKISGLAKNYGLGVIIANSLVFNPYYSTTETDEEGNVRQFMRSDEFKNQKISVFKQFDEKAHLLKTRNMLDMNNTDPQKASDRFNSFVDTTKHFVKILDNKHMTIVNPNNNSNVYINIPSNEKSTIASKDLNDPIFIDAVSNDSGMSYKTIYGLVVTKGNIFIYNEGSPLYLKGTFVSNQNIVFMGTGEKHVSYDPSYVYTQIAKESQVSDMLYADSGRVVKVMGQVNNANQLTSTLQGDLSLDTVTTSEKVSVTFKGTPTYVGSTKKVSPFTFKIIKWSVDH